MNKYCCALVIVCGSGRTKWCWKGRNETGPSLLRVHAAVLQLPPQQVVRPLRYAFSGANCCKRVEPGHSADFNADVTNQAHVEDRVQLRVVGLPDDWVRLPDQFETVPPGERINLSFQVKPPRRASTANGRHRFRVELVSQNHPDAQVGTGATLNVDAFERFEMDIAPTDPVLPGAVNVKVRNLGNATVIHSVVGRDDSDEIVFGGETGRAVPAGDSKDVNLTLSPKRSRLIPGNTILPFRSRSDFIRWGTQIQTGEALAKSIIPGWLSGLAFVILLSACFLITALLIFLREGAGQHQQPHRLKSSFCRELCRQMDRRHRL